MVVGIDKEMCGFHKNVSVNSIVMISAKKLTLHLLVQLYLSMLKIYSRCLICILEVKYTEFKVSYFTTVLFA